MSAFQGLEGVDPGSFRDPSGHVFWKEGEPYRQVNKGYADTYKAFMDSGLYDCLVDRGYLVPHEVVSENDDSGAVTIKPRQIPFISYPYEWSFSQLRDAALLTLEIQRLALRHGMILKDASAYNIQFENGQPRLIDTLSFEVYQTGRPWIAYRQFCQHFLAPLSLMAYRDVRLGRLLSQYIDGIPLDLVASLLPARAWFRFGLLVHLFLHARQQVRMADKSVDAAKMENAFTRRAMDALVDSLLGTVKGLIWNPAKTEWDDYYAANNNYSGEAFISKEQQVAEFLSRTGGVVWDMGSNDGHFSRIAEPYATQVISWDVDPVCVDRNYREAKQRQNGCILPLLLDLTNPSPGIGWRNRERASFSERARCDTMMALGLIHHLVIGNNLPMETVLGEWSRQCRHLVLEFIPKSDSQVEKLLASREDIWPDYHREGLERAMGGGFDILEIYPVTGSERLLYLCRSTRAEGSP